MTLAEQGNPFPQSFEEHLARVPEVIYADTAFRGDFDESPPQHTTRWISYYVKNGTQCHEYLTLNTDYEVGNLDDWKTAYRKPWTIGEALYKDRLYQLEETDLPASLHLGGMESSLQGWLSIVHFLAMIASVFIIPTLIISALILGPEIISEFKREPLYYLFFAPLPLWWITYKLKKSGYLAKFSKPKKPLISFHRATGLVTINTKKSSETLPFREFQCCGMTVFTPNNGIKRLAFGLKHRHSPTWVRLEGSMTAAYSGYPWPLTVRWELISHYMNVTRPLPDIPIFGPFRHLDPTTREWDKKHNRPKTVWLDMPHEEYRSLASAAMKAVETYPVPKYPTTKNSTDRSSLGEKQKDWEPAGDGKHWYQLG